MALNPQPLYSLEFAKKVYAAVCIRFQLIGATITPAIKQRLWKFLDGGQIRAQFYTLIYSLIVTLLSKSFYKIGSNKYTSSEPYTGLGIIQGASVPVDMDYVLNKVGVPELPVVGDVLTKQYQVLSQFICTALNSMTCTTYDKYVFSEISGIKHYIQGSNVWQGKTGEIWKQGEPIWIDKYWDGINQVYYKNSSQVLLNPIVMFTSLANNYLENPSVDQQDFFIFGNTYITLQGFSSSASQSNRHQYYFSYQIDKSASRSYNAFNTRTDTLTESFRVRCQFTDYSNGYYLLHNKSPFKVIVHGAMSGFHEPIYQETIEQDGSAYYKYRATYYSTMPIGGSKIVKVPNCVNVCLLQGIQIQPNQQYNMINKVASVNLIPISTIAPIEISGDSPKLDGQQAVDKYQEYQVSINSPQIYYDYFIQYVLPF